MHFGCKVYDTSQAKLTRENYAPINRTTRRNSFKHFNKYINNMFADLSVQEIIEKYWESIKDEKFEEYDRQIRGFIKLFDKLADPMTSERTLKGYIEYRLDKRLYNEEKSNLLFYIESQDPEKQKFGKNYAEVLKRKSLVETDDDDVRQKFEKLQSDLNKIKNYDIASVLLLETPKVLKEWLKENPKAKDGFFGKSPKEHEPFSIPNDWLKEYFLRDAPYYTDKKCQRLQERALINFDNNMRFFSSLDANEFNKEIDTFLDAHPTFESVSDLREYKDVTGIYIMVLDEYKQIYIGKTRSKHGIKGRIQKHWADRKPLDRLIFGDESYSILSIDSFRPCDTTRIFVEPHPEYKEMLLDENGNPQKRHFFGTVCNAWGIDDELSLREFELTKKSFSEKFLLNRCQGGGNSLINAVASIRGHELSEDSKKKLEDTKENLNNLL